MRVLISKALLSEGASSGENPGPANDWHVATRDFSADTTVSEVAETMIPPALRGRLDEMVNLWDCTTHPPKNISNWPVTRYADRAGPKSKTLFDAGWFPSGTWQVLPEGTTPSSGHIHEDAQYNLPTQVSTSTTATVQLKDAATGAPTTMKPSEVLQSVAERFPQEDEEENIDKALQVRRQKRNERLAKEAVRHQKLEERLRRLQQASSNNGKQKNVSRQVQKMLVKSRCTGSSSLKLQDRVYLHVVIVGVEEQEEEKEEYRYFSQQDTVARIVAALAPPRAQAELLVRWKATKEENGKDATYRRLPIATRLYEAISQKFLEEVDSVVIRCYNPSEEEPTTSVLDEVQDELQGDGEADALPDKGEMKADDTTDATVSMEIEVLKKDESLTTEEEVAFQRLHKAISAHDEANQPSNKGKKKKSSASEKVRTMRIKSRAKGDTKRVPKIEDRFFMELVVAIDDGTQCTVTLSHVFLAKRDAVGRILRDCVATPAGYNATILIPQEGVLYRKASTDLTLQEAESNGILKCFGRMVIRVYKE